MLACLIPVADSLRATGGTELIANWLSMVASTLPPSPAKLVPRGVARIPEDRHAVGVIGDLPVWENAVSERLRSPAFSHGLWVRRAAARAHAQRVIDAFDVRGAGADAPARALGKGADAPVFHRELFEFR